MEEQKYFVVKNGNSYFIVLRPDKAMGDVVEFCGSFRACRLYITG